MVLLFGDDAEGQSDVAAYVASQLRLQLHFVCAKICHRTAPNSMPLRSYGNAKRRCWDVLLVQCRDAQVTDLSSPGGAGRSLLFIAGRELPSLKRATVRCSVNKPEAAEQKQLWENVLGPAAARLNGSLDGVASQFRLERADHCLYRGKRCGRPWRQATNRTRFCGAPVASQPVAAG